MIDWIIFLVILAVIQARVFKLSKQELWSSSIRYGFLMAAVICETEWIRNASEEFAFEWWSALLAMFASFLTAKSVFYTKNATAKISAFSFSAVLTALAWLTIGDSLNEWIFYFSAIALAMMSLVISCLYMSLSEKLELSDVSKFFEDTPIFLIAAAFFIVILTHCFR